MNEEEWLKDLEEYFPIDLLTQEEREYAIKLDKEHGHLSSVKYIKSVRDDFGLKSSKIYYDLYISKNDMKWIMKWIIQLVKQFFCDHDYEFVRNIYGDEINQHNGYRSLWVCKKCGKEQYRYYLQHTSN